MEQGHSKVEDKCLIRVPLGLGRDSSEEQSGLGPGPPQTLGQQAGMADPARLPWRLHLEQQLVLGYSLHRFQQVGVQAQLVVQLLLALLQPPNTRSLTQGHGSV